MSSDTSSTDWGITEDTVYFLLTAYQYVNGTINYEKLAKDNNISTDAVRKRFKRAFDKLKVKAALKDNSIIGQEAATSATSDTATTPKRKAKQLDSDEDNTPEASTKKTAKTKSPKTPKSTTKKAKKEETVEDED